VILLCYQPVKVYDKQTGGSIQVACRKCDECMQTRANEWALRGHFELAEYKENCFITLTYKNNPVRLKKDDLQKFIKRLRKSIQPKKIKYFSVGEYGDKGLRPHYHIIIFGHDFNDKELVKMSASNKAVYESKALNKLWPEGIAIVQDANANTIRYSARYAAKNKKVLPENLKKYPEFNTMSQNLGINPILRKIETYLKTDEIYIDGFSYRIPYIVLQKYAKNVLGYDEENVKHWVQAYVSNREKPQTTKQELETRKRLAKKKRLHAKLKEL
jgi:hypothetical protein